jgi:hypothetical protein
VLARLETLGIEITRSAVRRPVRDQVRETLATGAFLPLRALKAHVAAATVADAKNAAMQLVQAGEAHLVLRSGIPTLVPAEAAVLGQQEIGALARSLDATLKQAKKAARAGAKLLRGDVEQELEPWASSAAGTPHLEATEGTAPNAGAHRGTSPAQALLASLDERVGRATAAVRGTTDPTMGLAFVPAVVRALSAEMSVAEALAALREAGRSGLIELRPESGLGRLTREERALCVPGVDGIPLSWARSRGEDEP